jgi:hypothetical protein
MRNQQRQACVLRHVSGGPPKIIRRRLFLVKGRLTMRSQCETSFTGTTALFDANRLGGDSLATQVLAHLIG